MYVVGRSAEFKCNDRFLVNDLIKLVEFKNSLLELKCAVNCFILFSNQNQQQIHRGVLIQKPSVLTTRGVPWLSRGVQVSLGPKYFWSCLQTWCLGVFKT